MKQILKNRRNERDMFGTPINRAKTWSKSNKDKDPKKDRKEWQNKK